ncbi:MAG: hypothetical protein KJ065_12150 [Anaerolineae bacterium]|nr:hypothetical protein [Anaerolineae bacterium]
MIEFRAQTPVDIVAQRLQALHQPARSIVQTWCKRVSVTPRHDGGYDFEIHGQEHKLSGDETIVQAIGMLSTDPVTSETVITGHWQPTYREFVANTIKGLVIFLGIMTAFLFIFVEDIEQRSRALLGFGLISLLVCVWLGYEYWRNRRGLARAIKAAAQPSSSAEGA